MKKSTKILIFAAILAVGCLCFVGCGDGEALQGTVSIVLDGQRTIEVDLVETGLTEGKTVADLLVWANEQGVLASDVQDSAYGAYVVSVAEVVPTDTQYLTIFVNNKSFEDTNAYCLPSIEFEGETFYYSGVGISDIKLADGLKLYFGVATF